MITRITFQHTCRIRKSVKKNCTLSILIAILLFGSSFTADLWSQTSSNSNPLPDWAFGGFVRPEGINPLIEPDVTSTFYCPMRKAEVKWEESDTFNPAAVVKDGQIYVLYRAEDNSATGIGARTSRIGLAESADGISINKRSAPVLYPAEDNAKLFEWEGGCEDPRVAVTEDGQYVMMYTSWNRITPRLCVATSSDLINWIKHGPAFASAYEGRFKDMASKSASIVTKVVNGKLVITKVNGKYLMYWGESMVNAATSDDLINWIPMLNEKNELMKLIAPRSKYFDSALTECGPPAVITDKGIVLLYNGKNATDGNQDERFNAGTYSAGQVLFDLNDPCKVLSRLDVPFFKPMESYEKSGQYVDGTVFIEGLTYFKEKWYLYYGCADSKVGVAIYDPKNRVGGDTITTGDGIGKYPCNGIGKQFVSIHSCSGQVKPEEGAFNLLYNQIDSKKKWCEDKNEHPWVIFELSDVYSIRKLVFRDVAPFETGNGNVPEYWIYVSTTNTEEGSWIEVVHKTGQENVNVKEDLLINPTEARYIKFVASRGTRTDNGQTENAVRIYGFDIYGDFSRKIERDNLISVGKSVMKFYDATSYYERPLHLLDGNKTNKSSKWAFLKAGAQDSLKQVIIDLEDNYRISKFMIYDTKTLDPVNGNMNGYTISISAEAPDLSLISNVEDKNTIWTKVVNTTGRSDENIKTDIIEPMEGRYVKLEIPRSRVSGTTRLYEFEVYGEKKNTAINQKQANLAIKIWPSRLVSGAELFIENTEKGNLNIYSLHGSFIASWNITPPSQSIQINLPVGTYIAQVGTRNSEKRTKIIVE